MPPLRPSARWDACDRRTSHRALRSLPGMKPLSRRSKLDLLQRPRTTEERVLEMLAAVKSTAENKPAVYRMVASDGEVVYIGKSKQLRSRLLSYFRGIYPDDKGARIIREADTIEWDYVPSDFAAQLTELRHIKKYRPRLNVAMK